MIRILKKLLAPTFLLSLAIIVGLSVMYVVKPGFLEVMELKALDLRFLVRGPIKPNPDVVIAVIDEKSVDAIGRWPWPRSKIAELIDRLSEDGAKSIGFDIIFSEPDHNTNLGLIDRLEAQLAGLGQESPETREMLARERELADNDLILSRAMDRSKTPVVLGYFFHTLADETVSHLSPEAVQAKIDGMADKRATYTATRFTSGVADLESVTVPRAFMPEANIPLLLKEGAASGYFNMFPDSDGTVRWVPMTIRCRDKFYLPLSLQALRLSRGDLDRVPAFLTVSELGVERASVGGLDLPTNELGQLLVNYRGPSQTFPHYSITDIIDASLPKGTFQDKIVLVGATAVGIYDLRVTPFDSVFPGIEIHANVIDNILNQDFLVRPGWTAVLDLAAIILIGVVVGLALPRLSALTGPVLGLLLTLAWLGFNYALFTRGVWLNVVYPVLTLVVMFTAITVYRYMTEEREKRKIKSAFSSYVNPSVVSEMLKNPAMLKLGGDKRVASVLFSDIRGFTTISERLDPSALVHLLNQYLTVMTDIVFKYNGLLDKYIGDAIMAVWGAPLAQPDHAVLACRTSLEMMDGLRRFREKLALEDPDMPFLDIGIGINSGTMIVGNMGSESRMDYTAIGDAVNLSSRLEGANKQYGTNIIIGEGTYEQIKDLFLCRELDSVAVKGKAKPARVYELLGEPGTVPEDRLKMAQAFSRGLAAYKSRNFDEAGKVFGAIHRQYPEDKPTQMYLERVAELKKNPPPEDWDCVFVMKTK